MSPRSEENAELLARMDDSAVSAQATLEADLLTMSEQEHAGAMHVIRWMKQNYMSAGYKRLGKVLVELAK